MCDVMKDMDIAFAKQIVADYIDRLDTIKEYYDCEDCEECECRDECPGGYDIDHWALIARTEEELDPQVEVRVDYIGKSINTYLPGWGAWLRCDEYDSLQELICDLLSKDYEHLVAVSRWELFCYSMFSKQLMMTISHRGCEAGKDLLLRTYPKRKHKYIKNR